MIYNNILETDSVLRTDLLTEDLLQDPYQIKIVSESQYNVIVRSADKFERSKTPGAAKNIYQVADLITEAIKDYEVKTGTIEEAKLKISWEHPDKESDLESLVFSLERREPGMFGRGAPFENNVKNLRPILREELDDKENPGYKKAILGYVHDNILRITCWARTNKAANDRSLWIENVMDEYMWWLRWSGIARILYWGQGPDLFKEINSNRIYGRSIDYFVRTEKLKTISQKEIESIIIRLARTGIGSQGPLEEGLP